MNWQDVLERIRRVPDLEEAAMSAVLRLLNWLEEELVRVRPELRDVSSEKLTSAVWAEEDGGYAIFIRWEHGSFSIEAAEDRFPGGRRSIPDEEIWFEVHGGFPSAILLLELIRQLLSAPLPDLADKILASSRTGQPETQENGGQAA